VPAKNWHLVDGIGVSGPEPLLSAVRLPALALAAALRNKTGTNAVVVPAPAHPCTDDQPAQFSERLAALAGVVAGRTVVPLLVRDGHGDPRVVGDVGPRPLVVVDDQCSHGHTIEACVRALRQAGGNVVGALAWSASDWLNPHAADPVAAQCWWRAAADMLGVDAPCPAHRAVGDPARLS
jgi:hypothetical protein